jgi:hypothetical protein
MRPAGEKSMPRYRPGTAGGRPPRLGCPFCYWLESGKSPGFGGGPPSVGAARDKALAAVRLVGAMATLAQPCLYQMRWRGYDGGRGAPVGG